MELDEMLALMAAPIFAARLAATDGNSISSEATRKALAAASVADAQFLWKAVRTREK